MNLVRQHNTQIYLDAYRATKCINVQSYKHLSVVNSNFNNIGIIHLTGISMFCLRPLTVYQPH